MTVKGVSRRVCSLTCSDSAIAWLLAPRLCTTARTMSRSRCVRLAIRVASGLTLPLLLPAADIAPSSRPIIRRLTQTSPAYALDGEQQDLGTFILADDTARALQDRRLVNIGIAGTGEDQNLRITQAPQVGQCLDGILAVEVEIQQDDVWSGGADDREHVGPGNCCADDLHARLGTLDQALKPPEDRFVVVDNHHANGAGGPRYCIHPDWAREVDWLPGIGTRTVRAVPDASLASSTEPPRAHARSVSEIGVKSALAGV